jgi:hypothetical protein
MRGNLAAESEPRRSWSRGRYLCFLGAHPLMQGLVSACMRVCVSQKDITRPNLFVQTWSRVVGTIVLGIRKFESSLPYAFNAFVLK